MAFVVPLKHQQHEDDSSFDITTLPDVVQIHICSFLEISSLMNLRLSCRAFKNVVEQPTVLELMPVKIRCSKQLQRVLESNASYNSFILSFMSLEQQSHFDRFVNRFGHSIRKLIVTTSTSEGSRKILTLLKNCNQLQELELYDLDFNAFAASENQHLCDQVIQNLKKLRKLTIHNIYTYQLSTTNARIQIDIFFKILSKCTNLEEFKIPEFLGCSITATAAASLNKNEIADERRIEDMNSEDEEDWEPRNVPPAPPPHSGMEGDGDVLIRSVLNYIASRDASAPRLKIINVTAIKDFNWNTFHEFAATCYNRTIRLDNMNSSEFSNFKNEMSTMHRHYHDIFLSAKVYHLHEGFPISKMDSLRKLTVYIGYEMDGIIEDANNSIDLPNLKNLELKFMDSASQKDERILTQKLLNTPRSNVKQLCLDWIQQPCQTICVMKIAKNFRNLTELNLKEWNGSDNNFIVLWTNLSLLESVTLQYCKNITNRAFVGDYDLSINDNICQRPFNRLTKLNRLVIEDFNGRVTDIAFLDSFRWMRLRYFKFFSTKIHMFSVDVYQAMVNSPFGKSIEYFSAPQPMSNRRHNAKTVLWGFRNLKKRFGDL